MPLSPKTALGPYEILSPIGAGGMGEVYRAKDSRLGRTVAIKVLPQHLSSNPDLRQRFEREARAVSSLNHQHICTLYDIGHQDGIDYLVMEYIEGETLATRLQKGALTTAEALQYSIQITSALNKAHQNGIVHRDLKPGNIMLTKGGIKLLDFGLAKLRPEIAPGGPLSQLVTANDSLTANGTVVGTLQYMAPEQLEGRTDDIDARTDIFAFGTLVYEMTTGKKAFEGTSHASLIAAILTSEPPSMTSLQPITPPALDRVVRKCLAKEPEKRWQSASDLHDELKWLAEGASQTMPTAAAVGRRSHVSRRTFAALACAVIAVTAGLVGWYLRPSSPTRPIMRLAMGVEPAEQLTGYQ
jgi:eukaryotic-like serine/threonine-protein kinase